MSDDDLQDRMPLDDDGELELDGRAARMLSSIRIQPLDRAAIRATVDAAMPRTGRAPGPSLVTWWTHAAALLLGAGLAVLLMGRGDGPGEVRVEVPVEVPVEIPVETIVERVVEVEVPVEVERIVVEDRLVPHPLQRRHDLALRAAAPLAEAAGHGLALAARLAERIEAAPPGRIVAEAAPSGRAPSSTRPRKAARAASLRPPALEIRRTSTGVTLLTRGTRRQVVEALIATLDGHDAAVTTAAVQRLEHIRRSYGEDAVPLREDGPAGAAMTPSGIRGHLSTSRRRVLPSTSPELWRSWWTRQSAGAASRTSA